MSQWYYVHGGDRQGPVERESLDSLVRSGGLSPDDLVWGEGMADWKPAREVPGLFGAAPAATQPPVADPANPYASPASMAGQSPVAQPAPEGKLQVIDPPAQVNVGGPIQLAFEILKKDFGMIFVAGLVYYAVVMGVSFFFSIIQNVMQLSMGGGSFDPGSSSGQIDPMTAGVPLIGFMIISNLVQQVIGVYMALGLTRVGMEVIEGKPVRIGALFGEGSKLIGAFFGSLLVALMAMALPALAVIPAIYFGIDGNVEMAWGFGILAFVLFLFPGIYIYLRFAFFQAAMVDQEMGLMDALGESSRLTHGNKWALFALGIVLFLIILAGFLALCIGSIFTVPLATLTWFVAYKWIAHGPEPLWEIHRPKLPGM